MNPPRQPARCRRYGSAAVSAAPGAAASPPSNHSNDDGDEDIAATAGDQILDRAALLVKMIND
jgi:hypothetical protein